MISVDQRLFPVLRALFRVSKKPGFAVYPRPSKANWPWSRQILRNAFGSRSKTDKSGGANSMDLSLAQVSIAHSHG